MIKLTYKTIGNEKPEGKTKVFFTCHPEDLSNSLDKICSLIFASHDCAIFYTKDMTDDSEELYQDSVLGRMNLFIIPVTGKLLTENNRAMNRDYKYALDNHIPVLPVLMEPNLRDLYSSADKFGDIQYLSIISKDSTLVDYKDKLRKYLDEILIDIETEKRIREEFDSYIFLSYRKKNRKYANELMKLIHKNPAYEDIAIWYDEFLTLGEGYTDNIMHAIEKCSLFVLLVTPGVLEVVDGKPNYVEREEYPRALGMKLNILPVMMEETDETQLSEHYPGLIHCIKSWDDTFQVDLEKTLGNLERPENNSDPEHDYYIGLAYHRGIDVEKDYEKAIRILTRSAESGFVRAMEQLAEIYKNGIGVDTDWNKSMLWLEKAIGQVESEYSEDGLKENGMHLFELLSDYSGMLSFSGNNRECVESYEQMLQLSEKLFGTFSKEFILCLRHFTEILYSLNDPGENDIVKFSHWNERFTQKFIHGDIDYDSMNARDISQLININEKETNGLQTEWYELWVSEMELINKFDHEQALRILSLVADTNQSNSSVEYRIVECIVSEDYKKLAEIYLDIYNRKIKTDLKPDKANDLLWKIADTYIKAEVYDQGLKYALKYHDQVRRSYDEVCTDYYFATALCYEKIYDFDRAMSIYESGIKVFEDRFGKNHPKMYELILKKADCLVKMQDYHKAIELYEYVLDYMTKADISQESKVKIALIKYNIYYCKAHIGEVNEHLNKLVESYDQLKLNGADDELLTNAMEKYADLLCFNHKYDEAIKYYTYVYERMNRESGILRIKEKIATCYMDNPDLALKKFGSIFVQILDDYKITETIYPMEIYIGLFGLITCYIVKDEINNARNTLTYIRKLFVDIYGEESIPVYLCSLKEMNLCFECGLIDDAYILFKSNKKLARTYYELNKKAKIIGYIVEKSDYRAFCFAQMCIYSLYTDWRKSHDISAESAQEFMPRDYIENNKKPFVLRELGRDSEADDLVNNVVEDFNRKFLLTRLMSDDMWYEDIVDLAWNIIFYNLKIRHYYSALCMASKMVHIDMKIRGNDTVCDTSIEDGYIYLSNIMSGCDQCLEFDKGMDITKDETDSLMRLADSKYEQSDYYKCESILMSRLLDKNHEALRKLGCLYSKGENHNFEEAEKYIKKSMENGFEEGLLTLLGLYMENDMGEAVKLINENRDNQFISALLQELYENEDNNIEYGDQNLINKLRDCFMVYVSEEIVIKGFLSSSPDNRYTRVRSQEILNRDQLFYEDYTTYLHEYWALKSPERFCYTF